MAKTNKKLSVKKETLRKLDSLTTDQLGHVRGGYDAGAVAFSVIVPPKGTGGCETAGCLQIVSVQQYVKGY